MSEGDLFLPQLTSRPRARTHTHAHTYAHTQAARAATEHELEECARATKTVVQTVTTTTTTTTTGSGGEGDVVDDSVDSNDGQDNGGSNSNDDDDDDDNDNDNNDGGDDNSSSPASGGANPMGGLAVLLLDKVTKPSTVATVEKFDTTFGGGDTEGEGRREASIRPLKATEKPRDAVEVSLPVPLWYCSKSTSDLQEETKS